MSKVRLARISDLSLFKRDFMPKFSKDSNSTSFKALSRHGWIAGSYNGGYYMLPQMQRSVEKMSNVVSSKLNSIGAMRISVPSLCKSSFLKQSERWDAFPELFKLSDRRNNDFALTATCEEQVCHLVSVLGKSLPRSRLPLLLYQITTKFRDELHPRNGLLRGREFLMKDLYSFDADKEGAIATYEKVLKAYESIFSDLGLKYFVVQGAVGVMGGVSSHEFHVESEAGEDDLFVCHSCKSGYNVELFQSDLDGRKDCPKCKGQLQRIRGIEIGHTFLLGTRYSKAFNITYQGASNDKGLAWMGCFGIGISRLVAACIEEFGTESRIALPTCITPHLGVIIPQKRGYRFEDFLNVAENVAAGLSSLPNADDFVFDDRHKLSIGRRLLDARNSGIPIAIVAGRTALEDPPKLELHWRPCQTETFQQISPCTLHVKEADIVSKITELCPEAFSK